LIGATGVGILGLQKYRGRERTREVLASSCIKQVGLALIMYASDNIGVLPHNLSLLPDGDYCSTGKTWVLPWTGTRQPESATDLRDGQHDFAFLAPGETIGYLSRTESKGDEAAKRQAIAMTKPGLLFGTRVVVVYADGHTEVHSEPPL